MIAVAYCVVYSKLHLVLLSSPLSLLPFSQDFEFELGGLGLSEQVRKVRAKGGSWQEDATVS